MMISSYRISSYQRKVILWIGMRILSLNAYIIKHHYIINQFGIRWKNNNNNLLFWLLISEATGWILFALFAIFNIWRITLTPEICKSKNWILWTTIRTITSSHLKYEKRLKSRQSFLTNDNICGCLSHIFIAFFTRTSTSQKETASLLTIMCCTFVAATSWTPPSGPTHACLHINFNSILCFSFVGFQGLSMSR